MIVKKEIRVKGGLQDQSPMSFWWLLAFHLEWIQLSFNLEWVWGSEKIGHGIPFLRNMHMELEN